MNGVRLLAGKELTATARNPRLHLQRGLFALALLVCAAPVLLERTTRLSRLADRGRELFLATVHAELYLLMLLAPLAVATAFSDEKEERTAGLLLLTPIAPWRLVLGKLLGRSLVLELVLLSGLPLLALAFVLGGVSTGELLLALAVVQVALLGAVAVATHAAVLLDGALAATVATYAFLTIFFGLGPLGNWALSFDGFRFDHPQASWMWISPFYTLTLSLGGSARVPAWQAIAGPLSWIVVLAAFSLASAGTLWSMAIGTLEADEARRRLQRLLRAGRAVVGTTVVLLVLAGVLALGHRELARHFARFWGLWGGLLMLSLGLLFLRALAGSRPGRRRTSPPVEALGYDGGPAAPARAEVWDNPVLWRELVTRGHGSLRVASHWIAGGLTLLLVLVMFLSERFYRSSEMRTVLGVVNLFGGGLLLLLLTSHGIVSERRDRTLPLLLASTFSMQGYLIGKAAGALRHAGLPLVLGFLLMATGSRKAWPVLAWLAVYGVYLVACGLHASARVRTPVGALGLAVGLAMAPLAGVALLGYAGVRAGHLAWALPFLVSRREAPVVTSVLVYGAAALLLWQWTAWHLRQQQQGAR